MEPTLIELESAIDSYNETAERPRYTKAQKPGRPSVGTGRGRPQKAKGWSLEKVFVSRGMWELLNDTDKDVAIYDPAYGQHGSKAAWYVRWQGELVTVKSTRKKADDFIREKEDT